MNRRERRMVLARSKRDKEPPWGKCNVCNATILLLPDGSPSPEDSQLHKHPGHELSAYDADGNRKDTVNKVKQRQEYFCKRCGDRWPSTSGECRKAGKKGGPHVWRVTILVETEQ